MLGNRDFLAVVEFLVCDVLTIARGGVDFNDHDRADDVEVAIDELPNTRGLSNVHVMPHCETLRFKSRFSSPGVAGGLSLV